MKQLQVHNPNTGEWWEMGVWEKGQAQGIYPRCDGAGAYKRAYDGRNYAHPLTKIDMPLEWKLGGEVLASVPEKHKGRVKRFGRGENGDKIWDCAWEHIDELSCDATGSFVILSPEPPKPRTAEDYLADILAVRKSMCTEADIEKLNAVCKAAEQHLKGIEK